MSDPERALATVTRLSALGARISVDDFGTGYSSLANLRRFPIDELKIDRSFVTPMLEDESDLIIVRSTINLGHDLGLRVIAEGVEDEATLRRLARLGCDLAQGYYMSKPLPPDAFEEWMVGPRHAIGRSGRRRLIAQNSVACAPSEREALGPVVARVVDRRSNGTQRCLVIAQPAEMGEELAAFDGWDRATATRPRARG